MEGRVNYAVVGVFIVMLTVFLFVGIFWMSTMSHGKTYHTYWVFVHEDVTGLSAESPVRFNGVKVGYVKAITLDKKNPKLVKLVLRIEPTVTITTSTYAILNAQGVTGVVYVNLKADSEVASPLLAVQGNPYPIIPSRPSLLMQLSAVLPEMTKEIQNLTASVSQVLDVQNKDSIRTSLKNMAIITQTLADNSVDFTETMKSLDNTLTNLSEASNQFPNALRQFNQTLDSVNRLSIEMRQTSKHIGDTMKSGQLLIHNFSDQVMPSAQQALSNLSAVTMHMQYLTHELERNPSMLVRGKSPATPGPGEK
ncbi:MAG: MCE family protein [Gammaproteobacteria bacterium CG_4_10_14_0_8_um_filter_38_16]|nr:MAG: MCE family protein [Gammaproteobacteria bacterium CG_4_10_14_0_8_um_filter_38_16]PJA03489.1 MAG: MCE family protein [Gammaproteobacteria bacterium CG_4_10_14_0_2_um_filter_38_22]PJB10644.1 MAG: MCE family protein [Gammaproteobacteria bacterium CG_4_9_14_3_um_filter_38_9]